MLQVARADRRRYQRLGHRWGSRFMASTPRSPWSFGELYGRPTRWATVFRSRLAGERIDASMRQYRNEILDCITLSSSPILDSLKRK